MSWRGSSAGHFDANLPDYKKMLQSRFPGSGSGSGWSSSTQSPYSSYSSRHSGINSRSRQYGDSPSGSRSPTQGTYVPYQPHKYGLASTGTSFTSSPQLENELRNLDLDNTFKSRDVSERNGGERSYGYDRQDYSLSSYRDNGLRMSDYSSDSLLNYRGNQRRSTEIELERPAFRNTSGSGSPPPDLNNDLFISPKRSSQTASDFSQFNGETSETAETSLEPSLHDTRDGSSFMSPQVYAGDRESLIGNSIHIPASISKSMNDLTHWQRQQRGRESEVNHSPQVKYSRMRDSPVAFKSESESPRQQSNQLENFRDAANGIIREKDEVIEKLKLQILALEESNREALRQRRSFPAGGHVQSRDAEALSKLQDMEYRNAELRKDLTQVKMEKEAEVEDLEIKLGAVEHENTQLKAALRKAQSGMLEEKLKSKDAEIEEWQNRFGSLKSSHEKLNQKLEGLERYMADLPTQEEFSKNAEELSSMQEELALKQEHIADLEERLEETTQLLSERELTIQELEGKQRHLADKMAELTREIEHIKSEGEGKALQEAQEQLQEVKESRNKLLSDCEKAKKLLLENHRGMTHMKAKHQNEVAHLKERLEQEEQSVLALREEVRLKEEQIGKLQKSRKEYADKSQDLESEKLQLKEQIKQFEKANTDETQKLQRRFVSEMSVCFTELQSLVQVCTERADGKEPNMSLLLGSRVMEEDGAAGGGKKEEKTIKQRLAKLKELRGDLEKVRKILCDRYAEEMGDKLSCATH